MPEKIIIITAINNLLNPTKNEVLQCLEKDGGTTEQSA
jgi:hypothetical protein